MKPHFPLSWALARRLGVAWMAFAVLSAGYAADDNRAGTFKFIEGQVTVQSKQGIRPATSGDKLSADDVIITGSNGTVSVILRDGTVLSIGKSSQVSLSSFEFNSTTQEGNAVVNLLTGTMRVITGLLAKTNPDRFKVTTPTSVVGVRGTDFIVETAGLPAHKTSSFAPPFRW